ncbi:DUF2157 domain-containing protein [Kordia algicida OT-1]|uniref:DUF2157 domain-containing protein n=1 Tax=Kordia algicida OT-1 TaxID=391587 RepID=A9DM25_9FLAO|nr:DUF2157 domain-containing protein [Kordia algicida]EDP97616.1 hypothetical protein KAOT1_20677 [Kordia algicida OT-1]
MSSKITRALPELVENGIITDEIAQNIKAYYATSEEAGSNKLFTIFGILGATLVGLGIILIMAHNWDNFSKVTKLVCAFLPMILGQVVLGYSIFKDKSMAWKEAATAFLFFAVGACIALVSQVYHVSGDVESFLLAWIVLCVPLLYVTKSKTAVILHLIFITYFAIEAGYGRSTTIPHLYFVLLALSLPRYYQMIQSKVPSAVTNILHWLFPLSVIIALPICIDHSEGVGFLMYVLLFCVFYGIGQLPYFKDKSLIQNGYRFLGSLGTIILLLILSFKYIWKHEFDDVQFYSLEFLSCVILFIIASILLYFNSKHQNFKMMNLFNFVFIVFGIIFMIGLFNAITATILVNILLFILGITAIKLGADTFHFGILNYGMLIIAALITCRFFDTNISYVMRGLLFVLIGAGFFATNYIMFKKQKRKAQKK